jgi:hypothetical protein
MPAITRRKKRFMPRPSVARTLALSPQLFIAKRAGAQADKIFFIQRYDVSLAEETDGTFAHPFTGPPRRLPVAAFGLTP